MATNTLNFSTLVVQVSSSESHLLGCKILPPNTLTPLCSPLDQRWAMKLYFPLFSARQLGQPCLSCRLFGCPLPLSQKRKTLDRDFSFGLPPRERAAPWEAWAGKCADLRKTGEAGD